MSVSVVIVDDEAILDGLQSVLEHEGWRVWTYSTGEAFLADLSHHGPDCLLLDPHRPAFFYRSGYSSTAPTEIAAWLFSLLIGAVLLTWSFNSTKGSILIMALFHNSVDVA